ncbi:MAG: SGNH/GDSL hydrolase family protein [Thermodesulfobacteriota bacterium]
MRSVFLKIIGVLFSFLVAFAVAEGAVRLFRPQEVGPVRFACDPELGEIPVPGQHGERRLPGVFAFTYSNNSLGWRGRREYRETKQTKYRVLFLGDSFTYGLGVNDDQTFAAQVEKILTGDRLSVEIMNAGCPGKGTDYELKLFDTLGRKFHPDLTVLCFFCNDFQDNERGEYYNIGKQGELQVKPLNCDQGALKKILFNLPGYNWLISWSQAANLVKQAGVDVLVNRVRETGPMATAGLVVSYNQGAEGFANQTNKRLTNIYIGQLNAAVKNAAGSLIMFYIPVSQEVREYQRSRTISADEQACVHIAADNGILLWSLTPLLALSGQPIDHLYYKEGHWTAAAHEVAARYMSRRIADRLSEGRQLVQPEPIN